MAGMVQWGQRRTWMLPLTLEGRSQALRILCLGAHCDDIEIGCGGTVLQLLRQFQNSQVMWVVFSSNQQRADEARVSAERFLARAAQKQVVIKKFRDGYLPQAWSDIKDDFEQLKGEFRPDIILTHHRGDFHQDHRLVAELTWNTFRDHMILEYEIPKYEGDLGRPNLYVALDPEVCDEKIDIIMNTYFSQHVRPWFERETFRSLMRIRGLESNAPSRYAEAFHGCKLRLDWSESCRSDT